MNPYILYLNLFNRKLINKRIFSDCPFKSNQQPAKFFYSDSAVCSWLRSVMHTSESDTAVKYTLWTQTLWYETHRRVWLRIIMHTSEFSKTFDSAV